MIVICINSTSSSICNSMLVNGQYLMNRKMRKRQYHIEEVKEQQILTDNEEEFVCYIRPASSGLPALPLRHTSLSPASWRPACTAASQPASQPAARQDSAAKGGGTFGGSWARPDKAWLGAAVAHMQHACNTHATRMQHTCNTHATRCISIVFNRNRASALKKHYFK